MDGERMVQNSSIKKKRETKLSGNTGENTGKTRYRELKSKPRNFNTATETMLEVLRGTIV